MFVHIYWTY